MWLSGEWRWDYGVLFLGRIWRGDGVGSGRDNGSAIYAIWWTCWRWDRKWGSVFQIYDLLKHAH